METLQVVIKPHHLKGNSWAHMGADRTRSCPLFEALQEMGHKNCDVGGSYASLDWAQRDTRYLINLEEWDRDVATLAINKANEGSEEEVVITLYKQLPMN